MNDVSRLQKIHGLADRISQGIFGSVGFLVDLELRASKGYDVINSNNRRVQHVRITYPVRHSRPRNNLASY